MTAHFQDENEKIPGTFLNPRQVRLLKFAVIVMSIILVVGFVVVLGAIVYQASNLGKSAPAKVIRDSAPPARAASSLPLRPGERISHMALDGNRLAVHIEGPQGAQILIVDLATGKVVSRVTLKPE